jgi:hypothetical protein
MKLCAPLADGYRLSNFKVEYPESEPLRFQRENPNDLISDAYINLPPLTKRRVIECDILYPFYSQMHALYDVQDPPLYSLCSFLNLNHAPTLDFQRPLADLLLIAEQTHQNKIKNSKNFLKRWQISLSQKPHQVRVELPKELEQHPAFDQQQASLSKPLLQSYILLARFLAAYFKAVDEGKRCGFSQQLALELRQFSHFNEEYENAKDPEIDQDVLNKAHQEFDRNNHPLKILTNLPLTYVNELKYFMTLYYQSIKTNNRL